jgi:hypothetical protein
VVGTLPETAERLILIVFAMWPSSGAYVGGTDSGAP